MTEEQFCPCCGRHCPLNDLHCDRGRAFAETGVMPHSEDKSARLQARRQRYQTLDTDNKLICNIRDLGHTVRALSDGKASQSRILMILNSEGTITQSTLTEMLNVQPGTVSEVIGKLERAGLIERVASEQDRRTLQLRLTPEGAEKAAEANEARKHRYEEMFACLAESEKSDLLVLLEKVNDDWQSRYGDRHCGHHHGGERDGEHGHGHHGHHGGHH